VGCTSFCSTKKGNKNKTLSERKNSKQIGTVVIAERHRSTYQKTQVSEPTSSTLFAQDLVLHDYTDLSQIRFCFLPAFSPSNGSFSYEQERNKFVEIASAAKFKTWR